MIRVVVTLLFIFVQGPFILAVLAYSSLWGAESWFTRKNRALFATLSIAMWLPLLGVRVASQTSPLLAKRRKSIKLFLCTHQSFSDALVLALLLWTHRHVLGPGIALYKRELGKLPLLGLLQKLAGNIPVDRSGDVESAKNSMKLAASSALQGYHVSGFPEGSRRRSASTGRNQVAEFKKGFFHLIRDLSEKNDVEVFPVVFVGSLRSWPAGRMSPIPGSCIAVRVGDPVLFSGPTDVEQARTMMQEKFREEIDRACNNKYSLETAFENGQEIFFASLFGLEMALSAFPLLGTLVYLLLV